MSGYFRTSSRSHPLIPREPFFTRFIPGAIDWGFRVILVQDALCSSADETHDAMMNIYMNRFGEQVETVTTETLLEFW